MCFTLETAERVGIKETRRQRLRELVDEFGSLKAISDRTGLNPDWLSQIKMGSGMGHKTARRLEDGCGKPEGWMDTPPDADGIPPSFADKWRLLTAAERDALTSMLEAFVKGRKK